MEVAIIRVVGTHGMPEKLRLIASGMVGAVVSVKTDEQWTGLIKTAVFQAGDVVKDVAAVGDTVTVPAEVLEASGQELRFGLYGSDSTGVRVIPTVWISLGVILPGTTPSGDTSTDASLPVWAQILGMLGDLNDLQTQVNDSIVSALNGILAAGGIVYSGAQEPADGTLLWLDTSENIQSTVLDNTKWVSGYIQSWGLPNSECTYGEMFNYEFIPVVPGKSYTFYNENLAWTADWIAVNFYAHDLDTGGYLSRVTGSGRGLTFTVPVNASYAVISARAMADNNAWETAVLEEGVVELAQTYLVSYALTNVTVDNMVSAVIGGDEYHAVLTANDGYELQSVTVTMGDADITASCYGDGQIDISQVTGAIVITAAAVQTVSDIFQVTNVLTNVQNSNTAATVAPGSSYAGTLTAEDGYSIASVLVSMGGTDITDTVYADGSIQIPEVTGDIVITATAEESSSKWLPGYINTSGTVTADSSNGEMYYDEYIPVVPGQAYTLYNTDENWSSEVVLFAFYSEMNESSLVLRNNSDGASTAAYLGNIYTYTAPENAAYMRVSARNMADYYKTAVIYDGIPVLQLPMDNTLWSAGYLTSDGSVTTTQSNGEMFHDRLIYVEPGATYRFGNSNSAWTSDWLCYITFPQLSADVKNSRVTGSAPDGYFDVTIPDTSAQYIQFASRNMVDYYTTATFEKIS